MSQGQVILILVIAFAAILCWLIRDYSLHRRPALRPRKLLIEVEGKVYAVLLDPGSGTVAPYFRPLDDCTYTRKEVEDCKQDPQYALAKAAVILSNNIHKHPPGGRV